MNLLNELRTRQELYVNKREELYLKKYSFEDSNCISFIEQALFILGDKIAAIAYETPSFFVDNQTPIDYLKWFDETFSFLLD